MILRTLVRRGATVWLLILLAGCSSSTSQPAPTTPAPGGSTEKVKLIYFNARGAEPVEKKLIELYTKEHPNIQIEYLATTSLAGPSDSDAIANLIFNVQAGNPVDVAKVEIGRTPLDLMAAKADLELSKIGGDAVKTRLNDLMSANLVQIKGGIWAMPYEYDPFGFIYNGTMWKEAGLNPDKPPATWDELRADAAALKAKFPNTWPICHPLKNLNKIQPYAWSAGGTYWDKDTLPLKSDLLNPGIKATYSFIREWNQKGWLNTEELNNQKVLQFMVSRNCAGLNGSTYEVVRMRVNDPKTDWRVGAIPPMDASQKSTNFAGGSALVIPSTSKHPKEALDFILWLTDVKAQRIKFGLEDVGLAKEDIYTQATPANKQVAADPKIADDPTWKGALSSVPTRPAGISPVYSQAYTVLAEMQERIIRGTGDIDAELKAAQDKIQKLIDDNVKKQPELYQ